MSMGDIEKLQLAREQLVTNRRQIVVKLAKPYKRGESERALQNLIQIQLAIEALDKALADEKSIEGLEARLPT